MPRDWEVSVVAAWAAAVWAAAGAAAAGGAAAGAAVGAVAVAGGSAAVASAASVAAGWAAWVAAAWVVVSVVAAFRASAGVSAAPLVSVAAASSPILLQTSRAGLPGASRPFSFAARSRLSSREPVLWSPPCSPLFLFVRRHLGLADDLLLNVTRHLVVMAGFHGVRAQAVS